MATKNKIGLHIETSGGVSADILNTATRLHAAGKPLALCVVIDDVGLANALVNVVRYVVFRSYPAGETFQMSNITSVSAAIDEANKVWVNHQSHINGLDKRIYLQTRNEKGVNQWDYAYELQMMQVAELQGRRIGMYGDSVGTPTPEQWQGRIQSLRWAMAHGHAAVVHQYSAFINGQVSATPLCDPATRDFYSLRHRSLYAAVPADARPLLLIGECGLSNGHPNSIDDWRGYNALLSADDYVGGCAIWGMGSSATEYQANTQLPALEQLVKSL